MIFLTSDCDLPQNEQSVMRDDFAIKRKSNAYALG